MTFVSLENYIPEKVEFSGSFFSPADLAESISGGDWKRYDHLDLISDKIADIRNKPLRLIVSIPPGHGKSELISHYTPVWYLSEFPDKRIGLATYESNFAAFWGEESRDTITEHSDRLGIELKRDTKAKSFWRIAGHKGYMFCAGVRGPMTGKRFNLLIIDDPIKNIAEAESAVYREATYKWWLTVARTRMYQDGSIILIMTRWHDDDLVGRIIENSPEDWDYVRLPALAEEDDILGREPGEPLCPDMFDTDSLGVLKEGFGGTNGRYWLGLYQQRPSKEEGTLFKMDWWQYYTELPDILVKRQYWDTAYKTKATSDYNTCLTLGKTEKGIYVLDLYRHKLEYPELERMAQAQYNLHLPSSVKVEDAASGQALIPSLKRKTGIPVTKITAKGSKEQRASLITGICEAERVFLPQNASWLATFLDEMSKFPAGKHDDIVDVFSYGVDDIWQPMAKVDQEFKLKKKELEFKRLSDKEF